MTFDELVEEAVRAHTGLWDLSFLRGRLTETDPSWDYPAQVRALAGSARALLDMGTGSGAIPASLDPAPPLVAATEAYPPMVGVAAKRLRARGMHLVQIDPGDEPPLPFRDGAFDVVINRHESFRPSEVARILAPGGTFLTQQVGGRNMVELNELLEAGPPLYAEYRLEAVTDHVRRAGLEVTDAREELLPATFSDVGAVVHYLLLTPWQVSPGFDLDGYRSRLRALHEEGEWPLRAHDERFLVRAVKREGPR